MPVAIAIAALPTAAHAPPPPTIHVMSAYRTSGMPRSEATKQNSLRSLENDEKPSTSSIDNPASATAARMVSSAS